jgi:hypothetical protein
MVAVEPGTGFTAHLTRVGMVTAALSAWCADGVTETREAGMTRTRPAIIGLTAGLLGGSP